MKGETGCGRCVGANVSVEWVCLLVQQPVPIFPARTQLPGVRVFINCSFCSHLWHETLGGRKLIMWQIGPSLLPRQAPCALPTSLYHGLRAERALEAQTPTWCHL